MPVLASQVGAALQEVRACGVAAFTQRRKSFFFQQQCPHLRASQDLTSKTYNSPWLCFPPLPSCAGCPQPSPAERPQVTASSQRPRLNCEQLNCQTCFLVGAHSNVLSAAPSNLRSFVLVFLTGDYNKTANGFPALKKKKKKATKRTQKVEGS